jgi:hypothetical protein
MLLDAATLRDLDVLSASHRNGPSLLGLVDRTRTRVVQHQLRRRLDAPADAPERILVLQRAHQALAADADAYRSIVDLALDGVEHEGGSGDSAPAAIRYGNWWRCAAELALVHAAHICDRAAVTAHVSPVPGSVGANDVHPLPPPCLTSRAGFL